MDEAGLKLLEGLVRTAEAKDEEAVRLLSEAITRFQKTRSDLLAYENALQAYIRDTDLRYLPPLRLNPLDDLIDTKTEDIPPAQPPAKPPAPRRLPKITKQGIILEALAKSGGKGLRVRELHQAIPKDSPIEIQIDDLYRALPRLINRGLAWRDERGRYYHGRPPEIAAGSIDRAGEDALPLISDSFAVKNN